MSFLGSLGTGAASALVGGLLQGLGSKKKTKQPQLPGFQRETIDQLLAGLKGQGPLANLFQSDAGAFQSSVVDPLLSQFQTQTAPAIQQRFISQGQQRGSPLNTALSQAGTDVQSQINQLFLPFQQQGQQNQLAAISKLLGVNVPQPTESTQLTPFGGALAGFSQSGELPNIIESLGSLFNQKNQNQPLSRNR
jgi:hypothetical protein